VTGAATRRLVGRAVGMDAVDLTALAAARRAVGSWEGLFQVLARERVLPLLGCRLDAAEFRGPARFAESVRVAALDTFAANLKRRKTFEEMRGVLAEEGIPSLPIKGVDVAFSVYAHPGCRPMADVDILVAPENYRAAGAVLRREGFRPLPREPRWWPGRSFCRPGEVVDLHWSPAAALPPRRGMASLCYVTADDETIKDEFRLLVSVCHHQNHFFTLPLLYYWESAVLARRVTRGRYYSLARRWGAVKATRFVLELARSFFGADYGPGRFGILKALAAPAFSGAPLGQGARAAVA
jgi:hypothetical protein